MRNHVGEESKPEEDKRTPLWHVGRGRLLTSSSSRGGGDENASVNSNSHTRQMPLSLGGSSRVYYIVFHFTFVIWNFELGSDSVCLDLGLAKSI